MRESDVMQKKIIFFAEHKKAAAFGSTSRLLLGLGEMLDWVFFSVGSLKLLQIIFSGQRERERKRFKGKGRPS